MRSLSRRGRIMGSASAIEMQATAAAPPPPVVAHTHRVKVWTASRVAPIIGVISVAVAEVAFRPDVPGSLIAVAAQIVLMSVLVKTWLSH